MPHNLGRVQLLQKVIMGVLLVTGILEVVASIDPRGLWGIFGAFHVAVLRDLVFLVLLLGYVLWTDLVIRSIATFLHKLKTYSEIPIWFTAGTPILITLVISVFMNYLGAQTNNLRFRIFFLFALVGLLCFYSLLMIVCKRFLLNMVSRAARKQADNGRLRRLRARFIAITVFCVLLSMLNIAQERRGFTFKDAVLFYESDQYIPYVAFAIHVLGAALLFHVAWLPLRESQVVKQVTMVGVLIVETPGTSTNEKTLKGNIQQVPQVNANPQ
jgi:hypothetical protein